jgi:hypothetical protein
MRSRHGGIAVALLGVQLAACAPLVPASDLGAGGRADKSHVIVREDLSGRFIALVGPKVQIDPPYLGTPDTNFACLRSFIDRRTGQTAHQLYVAASYQGNHDWTAAHDGSGQMLEFIPISRFKIACDGTDKCSYAEEFAAKIPKSDLSNYRDGFSVTFTDKAGHMQTVAVTADQVTDQLAALAELQRRGASASQALPTGAR